MKYNYPYIIILACIVQRNKTQSGSVSVPKNVLAFSSSKIWVAVRREKRESFFLGNKNGSVFFTSCTNMKPSVTTTLPSQLKPGTRASKLHGRHLSQNNLLFRHAECFLKLMHHWCLRRAQPWVTRTKFPVRSNVPWSVLYALMHKFHVTPMESSNGSSMRSKRGQK